MQELILKLLQTRLLMKSLRILFLILLISQITLGQTAPTLYDVIKKANYLLANKRYESAFKVLKKFDPVNKVPEVVLLKEDIALNYSIDDKMDRAFAFKDMAWNEDVNDYRGKTGSYNMYRLPINTILDTLIKTYPNNYHLYNALGNYYVDVEEKYGDKWFISQDSIEALIKSNYQIAIDHSLGSDFTYYEIGYIDVSQEKYNEAIPYFTKSISLNKENPDAYYNLAYAYLYLNDRQNALKNAKTALRLYEDSSGIGDAARMAGEIYAELKDTSSAIKYYELSNKVDSSNYNTLEPLLYLYVKTNKVWKAKETLEDFFYLDPENPTIYNDLDGIYNNSKDATTLIGFYKSRLQEYRDDKVVTGNLYFYLGLLYKTIDQATAKDYFNRAKTIFEAVYNTDDEVFKAINQQLEGDDK